jgi:hypothetical protein
LHYDKLHTLTWQDPTLRQIKSQVEPDPELPKQLMEKRETKLQLYYTLSNKVLEEKLEQTNKKLDEKVRLNYEPACRFLAFGLGSGNSSTVRRAKVASHCRSSNCSSSRKLGFAPG